MKKLSIIWDMTEKCPFNCPICCMGAKQTCANSSEELSYESKRTIIEQIRELATTHDVKIDLSGGEIMTDLRHLDIATEISKIIGKSNLGISTSGYDITDSVALRLSTIVGDVELTMDTPPGNAYRLRPLEYAKTAALAVPLLKKHVIHTGIQTVLAKSNSTPENLTLLYKWLCANQVDEWSLLRFYPVGRGADFPEECLNDEELLEIVHFIQELNANNPSSTKPSLHFHYTMKGHEGYTTECRCVKKSIGIFPNGDVTACFWASDRETHISEELFHLGNIRMERLTQILQNPRSRYWLERPHSCPFISPEKEDNNVSVTKCHYRSA